MFPFVGVKFATVMTLLTRSYFAGKITDKIPGYLLPPLGISAAGVRMLSAASSP